MYTMKTQTVNYPIKVPYEPPFCRERSLMEIRPLCFSPTGNNEIYFEEEVDW